MLVRIAQLQVRNIFSLKPRNLDEVCMCVCLMSRLYIVSTTYYVISLHTMLWLGESRRLLYVCYLFNTGCMIVLIIFVAVFTSTTVGINVIIIVVAASLLIFCGCTIFVYVCCMRKHTNDLKISF